MSSGSCDNRCTSGKEGTCQCSCGGANHGTAKKVWDVIQDGGNAEIKGRGLNLFLESRGTNQKGDEMTGVNVHSNGRHVQTYKSKEEFVKDLGKYIRAGQVEVTATDAYNKRQVNLPADPERSNREPKLTDKEAQKQIRAIGASVTRKDGEYRVNVPGGTEGTAYYTDDRKDAIATARSMMKQHATVLMDQSDKEFAAGNKARASALTKRAGDVLDRLSPGDRGRKDSPREAPVSVSGGKVSSGQRYHVLARDDGRVLHTTNSPKAAKKWADEHSGSSGSDNFQSVYDTKTDRVVYDGSSDGNGTVLESGFLKE